MVANTISNPHSTSSPAASSTISSKSKKKKKEKKKGHRRRRVTKVTIGPSEWRLRLESAHDRLLFSSVPSNANVSTTQQPKEVSAPIMASAAASFGDEQSRCQHPRKRKRRRGRRRSKQSTSNNRDVVTSSSTDGEDDRVRGEENSDSDVEEQEERARTVDDSGSDGGHERLAQPPCPDGLLHQHDLNGSGGRSLKGSRGGKNGCGYGRTVRRGQERSPTVDWGATKELEEEEEERVGQRMAKKTLLSSPLMDKLILDLLIFKGNRHAAEVFSREAGVRPDVDLSTIDDRAAARAYVGPFVFFCFFFSFF